MRIIVLFTALNAIGKVYVAVATRINAVMDDQLLVRYVKWTLYVVKSYQIRLG